MKATVMTCQVWWDESEGVSIQYFVFSLQFFHYTIWLFKYNDIGNTLLKGCILRPNVMKGYVFMTISIYIFQQRRENMTTSKSWVS